MTKVVVKTKDGIEFEAYPKDVKEWKKVYNDIKQVVKINKREEIRKDGKKFIIISKELYDRISRYQRSKETWENALLRELNRNRINEHNQDIAEQLGRIASDFYWLRAKFDSKA